MIVAFSARNSQTAINFNKTIYAHNNFRVIGKSQARMIIISVRGAVDPICPLKVSEHFAYLL